MRNEYPKALYRTAEKTIKKIDNYRWKYRNIVFLLVSIGVAYYILTYEQVITFIQDLKDFGYPAAFLSGMMFTYGLTVAPATAVLFNLGKSLNPILIAFIGASGSVISDYIIFRFVRSRLLREIKMLSKEANTLTKPIRYLFFWEELRVRIWCGISRSKIWQILIPVIGGFIIASPLPDELGAALFGAIKFDAKKFLVIAFVFNFIGILVIAYSAKII
ncbi:MAG: hypothetical protein HYW24_04950 [Candidatus Aenigmarchaeota archaeon]|nr:hypothetical protein [Candidatus Aenigmarchaeota archaeon]